MPPSRLHSASFATPLSPSSSVVCPQRRTHVAKSSTLREQLTVVEVEVEVPIIFFCVLRSLLQSTQTHRPSQVKNSSPVRQTYGLYGIVVILRMLGICLEPHRTHNLGGCWLWWDRVNTSFGGISVWWDLGPLAILALLVWYRIQYESPMLLYGCTSLSTSYSWVGAPGKAGTPIRTGP